MAETETLVETIVPAGKLELGARASTANHDGDPPPHQVIKLGIDVHLDRYVVVRCFAGARARRQNGV